MSDEPYIPARTSTVVVVTGHLPLDADAVARVPDDAIVIAADGGLDVALAAGLTPAGLVGDLDSVSADGLAWAEQHTTIDRYDPDKDLTDTELALAVAVQFNPDRLMMLAGGGDRLDHTIGAIGALGHRRLTSIPRVEAWWGQQHVVVVAGPGRARIEIAPGTVLSLLALHGRCTGVAIDGVRWPLLAAELQPIEGRGISNEATADRVDVAVSTGVLTIFINPR